jgi:hypothetical protein
MAGEAIATLLQIKSMQPKVLLRTFLLYPLAKTIIYYTTHQDLVFFRNSYCVNPLGASSTMENLAVNVG